MGCEPGIGSGGIDGGACNAPLLNVNQIGTMRRRSKIIGRRKQAVHTIAAVLPDLVE